MFYSIRLELQIVPGTIFGLIAFLHLVRALMGWQFIVGTWDVPIWVSFVPFVAGSAMFVFAFRQLRK